MIVLPDILSLGRWAMYSLLLPLDPNVQRHNGGAAVPAGVSWGRVLRDCCTAILNAVMFRHR